MSKESNHSRKALINIQYTDENECLKWCLVKYLHLLDANLGRIRKNDKKAFARELDFKDIKLPVKIKDIHKIDKKLYQH